MNPLLVIIIILGIINGIYYSGQHLTEVLMIVGLLVFALYGIRNVIRSNKWYRSMPTVGEYKNKHTSNDIGGGLVCRHCGSRSIRNWGRYSANDSERIFICNHCGKHLYRN